MVSLPDPGLFFTEPWSQPVIVTLLTFFVVCLPSKMQGAWVPICLTLLPWQPQRDTPKMLKSPLC
jgi:hypothetical protein